MTALFLAILFLSALLFSVRRDFARRLAVLGISMLGIHEAVLGISQVLGYSVSHHHLFALTGTLSNPGPYGGLMAVILSVTAVQAWRERSPLIPFLAAMGCLLVLPASMSRAAWLACGVSLGIWSFRELGFREWLTEHRPAAWLGVLALAAILVAVFCLKPESALGRFHIWHMDALAIAREPLTGWGAGKRAYAFGEVQAQFFSKEQRPMRIISLACCPEESFNEYLSLAVELGIPVLAAVLLLLAFSLRRLSANDSPFFYGLVAWMVFAFFSYPLSVSWLASLLAVFLGEAVSCDVRVRRFPVPFFAAGLVACSVISLMQSDERKRQESAQETYRFARMYMNEGTYDIAVDALEPLAEPLASDFRFLYDYGYSLHKAGRHAESNSVLSAGALISCDPMFHDIMGKNHEALGEVGLAEKEYLHARDMVPCRLYPYILLMDLKAAQGDTLSAIEYSRAALSLPVNPRHSGMLELRERAERMVGER